jgi:branched-chain amino acid aminotransferase
MSHESRFFWMDGELVPHEKATLHFLTPGLHYGVGVFEGIRCYETAGGPAVFRLHEHAARLLDSARCLGFRRLPWTVEEIETAVEEVVLANELVECYVRPLLWLDAGPGGGGWNLDLDGGVPRLGIAAWPWTRYLGAEALEKGVRANVSSIARHHPNVTMTKAKISGNYVNSFLAKTESVRLGFDEAILLAPDGTVAECTGENLFLVDDGVLVTVPTAPILEGITRDTLLTLAKDLGVPSLERTITRDQLYTADEVFVCGTAAECVAIREIDFRTIGSGAAGPVTRRLQRAYHAAVRGEGTRSAEWCHAVGAETGARRAAAG